MNNKISKKYMNKISQYFAFDWGLISISAILLCYSLLNYLWNNNLMVLNFNWKESFIMVIAVLLPISTIKFFISTKLKSRLIIEIIDEQTYYSLVIYNQSKITIDKSMIPLEREEADYFLNNLFSNRMGTIHIIENKESEKPAIVRVENRKYYLTPMLFENPLEI